jgi:hypothetical protein
MSARGLILGVVPSLCVLALGGAVGAAPALAGEGCEANEARRAEQNSTFLPDCRAYELVTSPQGPEPMFISDNGPGNQFQGVENRNGMAFEDRAAVEGNRFAFYTRYGAPRGSPSAGPYFLSTRTSSGWSQQDVIPPGTVNWGLFCGAEIAAASWSAELSKGVLADGLAQSANPQYADENQIQGCEHDEPRLVAGEPELVQNLFLRDSETGSYQLLDIDQPATPRNAWFEGASSTLSHVVITSAAKLTPEAPIPPASAAAFYSVGEDLYEYFEGVLRLVTILPNGSPVWGLLANGGEGKVASNSAFTNAVSADGEHVFFYAGGTLVEGKAYTGGTLYLRVNAAQQPSAIVAGKCTEPVKACTAQVDAAENGPGAGGGGVFEWASADGNHVFFTDESKLTPESKAEAGKPDLYEYDVRAPEGSRLTDLTAGGSEAGDAQGLSGVSEDGSYVYFVADGVLTGPEENEHHEKAIAGEPNLYVHHEGATTYIATLLPGYGGGGKVPNAGEEGQDGCDWLSSVPPGGQFVEHCMTARVSPNGRFLAFNSLKSLTGFDNTPVDPSASRGCESGSGHPAPCQEIFLYEVESKKLSCASCAPSGARPVFAAGIHTSEKDPGWGGNPHYLQRFLSNSGQVFFDTSNPLLPGALNDSSSELLKDASNVYEYEHGQLRLLSTGTSPESSYFFDASANGNDVFITTAQALVGSDTDATQSVYDVRVDGGFSEQGTLGQGGASETCSSAEGCRPPASEPPVESFPASVSFSGAGNLVSPPPPPPVKKALVCKKGFQKAKVRGKTVCKKTPKKNKRKTTKKAKKATTRTPNNRRGN